MTANYGSTFVVRKGRRLLRLLRLFQRGRRRGLGIVGRVLVMALVLDLCGGLR
jgi:hypothetical protein